MESEYARRAVSVDESGHQKRKSRPVGNKAASHDDTPDGRAPTGLPAVATTSTTRIHRFRAPTARPPAKGAAKISMNENFAGQTEPDNPPKDDKKVVDNDEGEDVEAEGEEVESKDSDSHAKAGDTESSESETEDSKVEASESNNVDLSGVRAVVRTGSAAPRSKIKLREITPQTVGPRVDANAGGSTCTPDDFTDGDLTWTVVDKGKKGWGVQVTGLTTSGQINVNPTVNQPASKTAPNTPNPVDGGNIENNEGSAADWRKVLSSLKRYHTKGGGRGQWHDTAASTAHEWAHWNTDWMKNCLGATWPKYRKKMERLRVSKATYHTAVAAKTALEPLVSAKLSAMDAAATKRWNKIPDKPGDLFANGYLAGQKVLDKHIKKVDAYATKKRWNLLGKVIEAVTPGGGGAAAQGGAAVAGNNP